jgi:hypothetical protein
MAKKPRPESGNPLFVPAGAALARALARLGLQALAGTAVHALLHGEEHDVADAVLRPSLPTLLRARDEAHVPVTSFGTPPTMAFVSPSPLHAVPYAMRPFDEHAPAFGAKSTLIPVPKFTADALTFKSAFEFAHAHKSESKYYLFGFIRDGRELPQKSAL